MSPQVTMSLVILRFSSAHDCLAPFICRRLFTHAFDAVVFSARINEGRPIATITTTTAPIAIIDFFDTWIGSVTAQRAWNAYTARRPGLLLHDTLMFRS